MSGFALGLQLFLNHHLCGYASVVGAGLPQRPPALHSLIARQCIHDGVLKRVAHVQSPGNVGRRNHDAERYAVAFRREIAAALPMTVEIFFNLLRIKCAVQCWITSCSRASNISSNEPREK